ncbi:MAG: type II toxin-antitoxin system RelE/ParE family toxin [Verrucomicrobia bacterium]|nr:type II toxin-antitoxin system RelE/ParE family toxin [Verrucomicrobiota bacterium]MDA0725282.1 type II toxin-antitoxin system RelE/ParE family toxin [Verrucomicrobiota bacterium]MDA1045728.1 type II toxin-antitoxin system RelE/ParE family toxin [Verrucomicrobiota bacterium]
MGERKIFVSSAFGRKIKKLKKREKKELDDAVLDLSNDPSVAEEKVGDLAGVSVYKFKINKQSVLLPYAYDENEINLLTFGCHENFYRNLKKYKKA